MADNTTSKPTEGKGGQSGAQSQNQSPSQNLGSDQSKPKIPGVTTNALGKGAPGTERPREHMSEPLKDAKDSIKGKLGQVSEKLGAGSGIDVEQVTARARNIFRSISDAIPADLERTIDTQLGQYSPTGFLGLALGAMGLSAVLALANERKGWSNFFGNWVPSLLFLTLYTKIIKLEQASRNEQRQTVH